MIGKTGRMNNRTIHINHKLEEPYASYGLRHFCFKYGIKAVMNGAAAPDIEIGYPEDALRGNAAVRLQIRRGNGKAGEETYLTAGGTEIPVFTAPVSVEVREGETLLAGFRRGGDFYPCVKGSGNTLVFGFDIFDQIGRVLSGCYESLLYRDTEYGRKLRNTSVVDRLEELLLSALRSVSSGRLEFGTGPEWPSGKKFAMVITHDVDRAYKTYQYGPSIFDRIRKADFPGLAGQFRDVLFRRGKSNPYWNFEKIAELEEEFSARSTFFFLHEKGRLNPLSLKSWVLFRGIYSLDDPDVIGAIKTLHHKGFEIGVHGSYYSYDNPELLKTEKHKLESITGCLLSGIRQHWLNFSAQKTFQIQEAAGFSYDSTIGFNPPFNMGFRRGTSYPFFPLLPDGKESSLLEIPLLIMDSEKNDGSAAEGCRKLLEEVAGHRGAATILWHQRHFNETEFPGLAGRYRSLLEAGQNMGAWIAPAGAVCKWVTGKKIEDER